MAGIVKTVTAVFDGLIAVEERISDFIANGPGTGLAGHVRDGYRTRCDQFANLPSWVQFLGSRSRGSFGRICAPYYASRGFDGPAIVPPFTGGQCDGIYLVTIVGTETNGSEGARFTRRAHGPIGGVRVQFVSGGYQVQIQSRGYNVSATNCGTLTPGAFDWRFTGVGGNAWDDRVPSIESAVACPGNPDNCGDPPGDLQPGPNPPPDPGPIPAPDPTDDPSNPTGPPILPIPDYDDPVGGPTPVEGPEQNPDVGPGEPSPGNPDTSPGSPDAIAPPVAVDPGPDGGGNTTSFGEPPSGRAWIGCFLVFDFPPAFGGISGSQGANLVSPRVFGNGSLVYEGGRGNAEKITSEHWQLFRPTGALAVTGVFVNVDPGFSYTVRPVSIELCPENNCGAAE